MVPVFVVVHVVAASAAGLVVVEALATWFDLLYEMKDM